MPAVRGAAGPPGCARCQRRFELPAAAPADTGIALEAFDRRPAVATPAGEVLGLAKSDADLRRISRLLRPAIRRDLGDGVAFHLRPASPAGLSDDVRSDNLSFRRIDPPTARPEPRRRPAWGVSLLLAGGGAALLVGLGLLAAAVVTANTAVWQAGMSSTVAGEGLLIVGLAWMAVRLWHNSRWLNRQVAGVDRKLDDYHAAAAEQFGDWRLDAGGPARLSEARLA